MARPARNRITAKTARADPGVIHLSVAVPTKEPKSTAALQTRVYQENEAPRSIVGTFSKK
jgi:hypothetical protein